MKILIASDKFKGSLSATQVCDAIVNVASDLPDPSISSKSSKL